MLIIELPQNYSSGAIFSVQVQYTSMPNSLGVTFLTASQTSGGTNPFMYTYSYMIQGRAFAPQQDTPSNRITWGGCVTTDSIYTPYMSGNKTGTYYATYGYQKTCFYNQIPAPNYLMNVVVGELVYASTGRNTGILAEPSVIAMAETEFDNLQALLDTTENYV